MYIQWVVGSDVGMNWPHVVGMFGSCLKIEVTKALAYSKSLTQPFTDLTLYHQPRASLASVQQEVQSG